MEQANSMLIQLGMTPRYLDARCHEALFEVDVGVNEVRGRLGKDVAREELVEVRGVQMSRTCASQQGTLTHR